MLPKPNTQALSWFYGEHKKGSLKLTPKYQRNPIWSLGQKCFLIDSMISDCPIPQVFINVYTAGRGAERQTVYEFVDGQQRLRAILEFMNNEWPLAKLNPKSYPVSSAYTPLVGKRFSELADGMQESIWNYPLAVQELRGWDALQIRALFRRLNYVVEKLNKQEMRHSQYFGEFVGAAENLAMDPFWDDVEFFSRHDSQRMKDIEFVSELFVLVMDGVQDQQKSLNNFYANYDASFPAKHKYVGKFRHCLESLRSILGVIKETRFKKKADFYGLFAAVAACIAETNRPVDLTPAQKSLKSLSGALDVPPSRLRGMPARYYGTVIEGPNKLAKRKLRQDLLSQLLLGAGIPARR